jgi:UDP-glucose 4-epimerase
MSVCLVTGGGGFIGSHLVEGLLANGHTVRVLDDFSTGSLSNLAAIRAQIQLIRGDVLDLEVVRRAVEDVEFIFHLAGSPSIHRSLVDPLATHRTCLDGTLHVLQAAREARVQRVIYGSSAAVYGDGPPARRREFDPTHPHSPYAVATLAAEHYCVAFTQAYGLETVRLRYFNVCGPRQTPTGPYAAVVPLFIDALVGGRRPAIQGDGLQTRDFTSVDDVVQASLLAAEGSRASGRVYNIGTGRGTSLLDLVERLNALLETEIRPLHTPSRSGDIHDSVAEVTRAQADLGYCSCTDLDQTLRRCIDHLGGPRKKPRRAGKPICPVPSSGGNA